MKRFILSAIVICASLFGLSEPMQAQTFTSGGPTNLTGGTNTVPLVVPNGTGVISDVNVSLDIQHNFSGELAFTVTSPMGTSALFLENFYMGNDFDGVYVFDDQAGVSFSTVVGTDPLTPGTYWGYGNPSIDLPTIFSAFNGEVADGIWNLQIVDGDSDGGTLNSWSLILEAASASAVAPAVSRRREVISTILATNAGAIQSLLTSGLGMGLVNQQVTQGAPNAALSDLNNRLFRARSGRENAPSALVSTIGGDSSLLRYLAFNQDENMSYKVALGLADAEERTVEVGGVADTLVSIGLSGGLPYAMMGVPLMPMAGGAATVHIVEAAASGKTVIDDAKAVVEGTALKRWEIFVAGDFSNYDQDQLTNLMQGFTTTSYAGTAGLEYRATDWLNLGAAWSYLQSDTNVSGNYGNIDLEGNLISGYATAFWRQYWADLLYSYGSFNNEISRNTGLGSRANGDTDSQSHNIRLNFGRNFNVTRNIVTGPIAGLRYGTGDVDAYNERGGGSAALNYNGTDFESMISRIGWQATHTQATTWGRLVSQVHLAWEHEYMPENGTVGASLQTSPFALVTGNSVNRFGGFSAEDSGAHAGTDWLSAGAGLRFELASGVALLTDYQGVFFRSNSSQHYASAKLSYEWGAFMPKSRGGGGKAVSGKAVTYEAYDASSEAVVEAESATKAEDEVVAKKKSSGGFASWLGRKGR